MVSKGKEGGREGAVREIVWECVSVATEKTQCGGLGRTYE